MVELLVQVGVAGAQVQLHEAGGPAVIRYSSARVETVPEKDSKSH